LWLCWLWLVDWCWFCKWDLFLNNYLSWRLNRFLFLFLFGIKLSLKDGCKILLITVWFLGHRWSSFSWHWLLLFNFNLNYLLLDDLNRDLLDLLDIDNLWFSLLPWWPLDVSALESKSFSLTSDQSLKVWSHSSLKDVRELCKIEVASVPAVKDSE